MTGLGILPGKGRTKHDDDATGPLHNTPPHGALRGLLRRPAARFALSLAALLGLIALLGPLVSADPNATDYANTLAPPDTEHWLGTDHAGRDLVARTVAGARSSLSAALLVTTIAVLLGIVLGTLAGALGGVVDT